ncbi:hypothetical protein [Enterococcus faecium]|nr:hypothetical protein [Enterococcus faecium]EPI26248.1 hypothetical protein D352_00065 [Enterococcus faecium LA4B-2]
MLKYIFEFKLNIVHDYFDGEGGSDYLFKEIEGVQNFSKHATERKLLR